jgi:hypothetical protein
MEIKGNFLEAKQKDDDDANRSIARKSIKQKEEKDEEECIWKERRRKEKHNFCEHTPLASSTAYHRHICSSHRIEKHVFSIKMYVIKYKRNKIKIPKVSTEN